MKEDRKGKLSEYKVSAEPPLFKGYYSNATSGRTPTGDDRLRREPDTLCHLVWISGVGLRKRPKRLEN